MNRDANETLEQLLDRVRACRLCADALPHAPRPVVHLHGAGRILLVGQAPGTRVHASGISWNDASGDTLRNWLGVDREQFYDTRCFAIMSMGFCYPGRDRNGGDAPPRPECAPAWHDLLLTHLPALRLRLAIGRYAQDRYLAAAGRPVAEVVADWRRHLQQGWLALPHPSPRNRLWMRRNPWFEAEVLPALRRAVASALNDEPAPDATTAEPARDRVQSARRSRSTSA